MGARTISCREVLAWALFLFVLGAGIRLWFVIALHPPADHIASDMWVHDFRARRLLNGPLDAWDTFTPVGYPALLAAIYALAGASGPTMVGVLQALLGGYEIPQVTRVSSQFGMPGGGLEMKFPYAIPPEFIKVIAP